MTMHLGKVTAFLLVLLTSGLASDMGSMCDADFPAVPCKATIRFINSDYKDTDKWFQLGEGSCVKLELLPELNWWSAETACRLYTNGNNSGHLVSIRDEQELNGTICAAFRRVPFRRSYWIGLSKIHGRQHLWTDGSEYEFTNWGENQPNFFHAAQSCVEINYLGWGNYNDVICLLSKSYICQVRLQ